MNCSRVLKAEGHLIDSGLMTRIMDIIILHSGEFEILNFDIGRTNQDYSNLEIMIIAGKEKELETICDNLLHLGCFTTDVLNIRTERAEQHGSVPPDFFSTSNQGTEVFIDGRWQVVKNQRMDTPIVVRDGVPYCTLLRDVRKGDEIVCGPEGVRITPEFKERDRGEFSFMSNEISSERKVEIAVRNLARMMEAVKKRNGRIVVVSGPVVVHTGGVESLSKLVRQGYVDCLLGGNAIAVHDVEYALYGTSLGVDLATGKPVDSGHRNHMAAINTINTAGGIAEAVSIGIITSGIMYECVRSNMPFVLAGSLRDDGPLLDTKMDMIEAQEAYTEQLKGAELVIMLASMLHSIAVGNMLHASVTTVCVDINPAVVTKLSDRGTSQARGIVTDVGLFLHLLTQEIGENSGFDRSGKDRVNRKTLKTDSRETSIV